MGLECTEVSGTETSRDPQGDNNRTILSGEISEDSELWGLHVVSGYNLDTNILWWVSG